MYVIEDELHYFQKYKDFLIKKVRSEPRTTFDHVREWRGPADHVHKFISGTHKIAGLSTYPCCESVTFWYGSGCGSERSKKTYESYGSGTFFKDKKARRSHKTVVKIKVFFLFLLDDGRIRIRTCD